MVVLCVLRFCSAMSLFYCYFIMPSKAYQKRQKSKQRYNERSEAQKVSSQQYYREHRQEVTDRVRARRADETVKKHNQQCVKQRQRERRDTDESYKERNRQAVRERLQQDQTYKEKNRQATRQRLQQDQNYKLANYNRAKKRLLENDSVKEKHRQAMRQRLQQDQSYKDRNRQATRERLQQDHNYKLANYKRAKKDC